MKTCERCGRDYDARSPRQRWCNLCRPKVSRAQRARGASGGWFGFQPEVRVCASCGGRFMARHPAARFCCDSCRSRTERPEEAMERWRRLYGGDHPKIRRMWAPIVAEGGVVCSGPNGCGQLIRPGEPWDLGHPPGGARAPQHARCNRATARRRTVASSGPPVDDSWRAATNGTRGIGRSPGPVFGNDPTGP